MTASSYPIKYLSKPNGGQGSARNCGVAHSNCDLIAFLDQDDIWYPRHLSILEATFLEDKSNQLGWVYSNLDKMRDDGLILDHGMLDQLTYLEHPKTRLENTIGRDLYILPSASLISRAAFDAVGGFNETLRGFEDDDLFQRLFLAGYTNQYINESLSAWRHHAKSTSYSNTLSISRTKYYDILVDRFPDAPKMGQYYTRDFFVPRFFEVTIGEFFRGWCRGDKELLNLSRQQLKKFRPHLTLPKRILADALLFGVRGPLAHPQIGVATYFTLRKLRSLLNITLHRSPSVTRS